MPDSQELVRWRDLQDFAAESKKYINSKTSELNESFETLKVQSEACQSELSNVKFDLANIQTKIVVMQELIDEISKRPSGGETNIIIQDTEPDEACIWIRPIQQSEIISAILELAADDTNTKHKVTVEGNTYAIKNAVNNESELSPGKYAFVIDE